MHLIGGLCVALVLLALVGLLWVFYPAITCRIEKKYPTQGQQDQLFISIGKCDENQQLYVEPTCDELRLPIMLDETLIFMRAWCKKLAMTYEVIVVDDGSSDNTVGVVRERMMKESSLKLLKLGVNRGKGGAIKRGVRRCGGRYILMADADAATDIRDFEKLFHALQGKQTKGRIDLRPGVDDDIVGAAIGSRAHMEGESVATRSALRTFLMYGFHLLVVILCTRNVKDTQCGFKLFTRRCARVLFDTLHLERWSFDTELIFLAEHLNIPLVEVPVNWHEVDGSKLIQSGVDVATTSLTMARDMLCVRLSYLLGIWSVSDALSVISMSRNKHPGATVDNEKKTR